MKRHHSLLALAVCIPLTAAVLSPASTASIDTSPPSIESEASKPAAASADELPRESWLEGTISSWRIREDGGILIRLDRADGSGSDWMRTAANQSAATQFELLVLHAVLALDARTNPSASRLVRVRVESSTSRDGDKPEDALRLTAIGRGT